MEHPSAGMISWAQALGIRYGVDFDPQSTSADALFDLVEAAMKDKPHSLIARLKPLTNDEYEELPEDLQSRAKAVRDAALTAKLALDGKVAGAVIQLNDRQYTIERVSARGNSRLRALATGKTRMVMPGTLKSSKLVN